MPPKSSYQHRHYTKEALFRYKGIGKTKGFLWAASQDPALKVGLSFLEVSAKHRIISMCSNPKL